jgi:hypothetical protein
MLISEVVQKNVLKEDWIRQLVQFFTNWENRNAGDEEVEDEIKNIVQQQTPNLSPDQQQQLIDKISAQYQNYKSGRGDGEAETQRRRNNISTNSRELPIPQVRPEYQNKDSEVRNIRNNNPGNIKKTKENLTNPWQGMKGTDGEFVVFDTPQNGIRALTKLLYNYQKKYNLYTTTGIITRWAPPDENDTASYIDLVVSKTGVGADEQINLQNNSALTKKFITGIIQKEGSKPAVDYFKPYIDAGMEAVN